MFKDSNELYETVFVKKAGSGTSALSAFEIAVSQGNHSAIEIFNSQNLPTVSVEIANSILKTAIDHDRGSTLGYLLQTTLKFLKDGDLPKELEYLL